MRAPRRVLLRRGADHPFRQSLSARADPGFDPASEDAANAEAAAVGLAGAKDGWTWENWMAVEAARGLPPTCWSCAALSAGSRGADPGRLANPRIAIGTLNTTYLVTQTGAPANLSPDDLSLRAVLGLLNAWRYLTAPDVLALAPQLVDALQGGSYLDAGAVWQNLLAQGGFAPTPASALPDDQVFMVAVGFTALLPFYSIDSQEAQQPQFQRLVDGWRLALAKDPVGTGPFAEWLRQAWG